MRAPKFSVVVEPLSVEMSAEKRPGAPLVLVMVELRCTVILLSASIFATISATPVSSGSAYGMRSGTRLYSNAAPPPSWLLFSTMVTG
jgi:hypothetical protein